MSGSSSGAAPPTSQAPSGALAEVIPHQPAAALALDAALRSPTHAFMFTGPPGTGKRAAARAFAAELLADGAPDPPDARRRALADPSPHPDLVWLEPPGAQHLVETVREQVIAAASYRPFEGARRVFVVSDADAMAEESQNALLKTLEEPAPYAHLILITAEPEALLETVRSRCRAIRFAPLPPEATERMLADMVPASSEEERRAAARLSGGDVERARLLCSPSGRELRDTVVAIGHAARVGELADRPWERLLAAAERGGEAAGQAARASAEATAAEAGETTGPAARRRAREAEEGAKRVARRERTRMLDLGLELLAAWLRDLTAVAEGAPDVVLNTDRIGALATDAEGLDGRRARRGGELVMDTRRRLTVNVNEELALEALLYRLESLLATR